MNFERHNRLYVKPNDKIWSIPNQKEYVVSVVDENGVYTSKDGFSFPNTPRLDFKDFRIIT